MARYGVDNISKHPFFLNKIVRNNRISCFKKKIYKLPESGQLIGLQGFEPQFLNFVFSSKLLEENEIIYSPDSILYTGIDNKTHHYFPDFYIPKLNLIVEIKSDKMIEFDKNFFQKQK